MNSLGFFLPLHAGRLTIRHFREDELDWLFTLETDRELKRYVDRGPYTGGRDAWFGRTRMWLKEGVLFNDYCLAVVDGSKGVLEGTCGLGRSASAMHEADLRIVLAKRTSAEIGGRGIPIAKALIKQAFSHLGVCVVLGQVDSRNHAAVRLVEALSFQRIASEPKENGGQNLRFELHRSTWNKHESGIYRRRE